MLPRDYSGVMATKTMELTKLALDNFLPATQGQRYEVADTVVKGLRVRVTDASMDAGRFAGKAAHITIVMIGRFPPSPHPVRRTLGRYRRRVPDVERRRIGRRIV